MQRCPACGGKIGSDTERCPDCYAGLVAGDDEPNATAEPDELTAVAAAGTIGPLPVDETEDQPAERERFKRRYGIDIGDRTVEEYLDYLSRQDYSKTTWLWVVVLSELAGITLFFSRLLWDVTFGVDGPELFVVSSVALALSIFADSRLVGQFGRWTKIRWTYVLSAAVPLIGHLTGLFYLVLRRFMHEEAVENRRCLLNAGVDLDLHADD